MSQGYGLMWWCEIGIFPVGYRCFLLLYYVHLAECVGVVGSRCVISTG